MIVYYDPLKFSILGMSGTKDPNRPEPFFETNDERALDIFLGKDKISKYEVLLDPHNDKKGFLKLKHSNTSAKSIDDRIYLIPQTVETRPDVQIIQDKANKSITIRFSDSAKIQLDGINSVIGLSASWDVDPYQMMWVKYIPVSSVADDITFNYQGIDNFRLFTDRLHNFFYHHECS